MDMEIFGKKIERTWKNKRTPLDLLGDYLEKAQAAQARGGKLAAHDAAIRGLVEVAKVMDPVNRNRLGLSALQTMLGEALKIEEETQPN